ncbi:MAG: radical SAM protein [Candidatus Methanomethylophilaceae archaeon]|jgi:7-carboxy-7-deazaguanine synthase
MKICEYFMSIQGEGLMMGVPTYFVRTAGCNLHCSWCDTGYSQSPDSGKEMSIDEIMAVIGDAKHVCVTGGEPLLQEEMPELLRRLIDAGKQVVLETNGAADLSVVPNDPLILISMDIKCPSSGMQDRMNLNNLDYLTIKDQLKFIIADEVDLDYAADFITRKKLDTNIIFSPVGGMDLEPLVAEVLYRKLDVRVLLQLHKIIWGDKRAV